jgi:hypothetical protein
MIALGGFKLTPEQKKNWKPTSKRLEDTTGDPVGIFEGFYPELLLVKLIIAFKMLFWSWWIKPK